MNRVLCIWILALLSSSCSSLPKRAEKLPPLVQCTKNPNVSSTKPIWNELTDLKDLSYSYTYNVLNIHSDSLEREIIRSTNARISKVIVQANFPEINILPDSLLRLKDYDFIQSNTASIFFNINYEETFKVKNKGLGRGFPEEPNVDELQKSIGNLIVPTVNQKQLFIEVSTYFLKKQFRNKLNIYIFNSKNRTLLYKDQNCLFMRYKGQSSICESFELRPKQA